MFNSALQLMIKMLRSSIVGTSKTIIFQTTNLLTSVKLSFLAMLGPILSIANGKRGKLSARHILTTNSCSFPILFKAPVRPVVVISTDRVTVMFMYDCIHSLWVDIHSVMDR